MSSPRSLTAGISRWEKRSLRLPRRDGNAMSDPTIASGTAAVTDRRPVPRGVLPRGMQTWLMAGIAGVMVLIMFVVGRPEPARRSAPAGTAAAALSSDRLREYQDRLRIMETRAAQEAQAGASAPPAPITGYTQESVSAASQDPIVAERKRRQY